MNMDISPERDVLAVGMDHLCQLYRIDYKNEDGVEKVDLKGIFRMKIAICSLRI